MLGRGYVEKKTRGCAVPVAESPQATGADFAETGFFFANAMSKRSILRCSCRMGRLGWVMKKFCHSPQGPAQLAHQ
jgi:hypothetical protein